MARVNNGDSVSGPDNGCYSCRKERGLPVIVDISAQWAVSHG